MHFDPKVSFITQDVTELKEAPDLLWDYNYYVKMKGDPKSNGHSDLENVT